MCCGLGSCFKAIFCCGSAKQKDEDDDLIPLFQVNPVNVRLASAWETSRAEIESLNKKLDAEMAKKDMIKGMIGRAETSFSAKEKAIYAAIPDPASSASPSPSPFAFFHDPAAALRHRAPATSAPTSADPGIARLAGEIEAAVKKRKFNSSGVKFGNWASIRDSLLPQMLQGLRDQGLSEPQLVQILNALPDATRKDFIAIGIQGLLP
jgi:hypothetical protein